MMVYERVVVGFPVQNDRLYINVLFTMFFCLDRQGSWFAAHCMFKNNFFQRRCSNGILAVTMPNRVEPHAAENIPC
ncbi:hypothetical protein DSECCO2_480800 [anaerobic digester metagenome]